MFQVTQTCGEAKIEFEGEGDDADVDIQVGMFLGCYWYGMKYDCSDLFKLSPTDDGFCCSFNTLAMEEQL